MPAAATDHHLVFHLGALGDWALTLPLLRALRGDITFVGPWSRAQLTAKLLANVTPMDIELREFGRLFNVDGPRVVSPAVAALFGQTTHVLSFISDGRDAWASNVARLCPQAMRLFVDVRPKVLVGKHVTACHRAQLAGQGFIYEPVLPLLATHGKADRIVIHPGSGGRAKLWPLDRFRELAETLQQHGYTVDLIAGEVEVDIWSDLRGCRVLTSLPQLHDTIARAKLYLGNDAGPTHLAAAMGVPTIALFGPTDPAVWQPVGPAVTVLAPPTPQPMDWLDVQSVCQATTGMLSGHA